MVKEIQLTRKNNCLERILIDRRSFIKNKISTVGDINFFTPKIRIKKFTLAKTWRQKRLEYT